jgi:hypothetical protein
MLDFKKALVYCAAIASFLGGAGAVLNGADTLLQQRVVTLLSAGPAVSTDKTQ